MFLDIGTPSGNRGYIYNGFITFWKNESIFKGPFSSPDNRDKSSENPSSLNCSSYGLKPSKMHAALMSDKSSNNDTVQCVAKLDSHDDKNHISNSSTKLGKVNIDEDKGDTHSREVETDTDDQLHHDSDDMDSDDTDEQSDYESSTSYEFEEEDFTNRDLAVLKFIEGKIFACLGTCKNVFSEWMKAADHMYSCENVRKDEHISFERKQASNEKAKDLLSSETSLNVTGRRSLTINAYIKWLKTREIDKVGPNMLQLHVSENALYSALKKFRRSYFSEMEKDTQQLADEKKRYKDKAMYYLYRECGWTQNFSNFCVGSWEEFIEDFDLTVSL